MMRLVVAVTCMASAVVMLARSADSARSRAAALASSRNVDFQSTHRFQKWVTVEDLPRPLAIYDTVFWEPEDTISLRQLIRTTSMVKNKTVLEIGAGSGLISLCCLQAGARFVVATDVNPAALACTLANASEMSVAQKLRTRRVSTDNASAFAVIGEHEKFDLIISNPPWEDVRPDSISEYALYDPGFALLTSLIKEAKQHLNPGGKILLAYGCTEAIERVVQVGQQSGFRVSLLDDRTLTDLEPTFLPGMLIELLPNPSSIKTR